MLNGIPMSRVLRAASLSRWPPCSAYGVSRCHCGGYGGHLSGLADKVGVVFVGKTGGNGDIARTADLSISATAFWRNNMREGVFLLCFRSWLLHIAGL